MAIDWDKMSPRVREAYRETGGVMPLIDMDQIDLPKPNKYRAKRTEYNGVVYHSKAEANRAAQLDRDGLVRWWIGQPTFRLGCPENVYRADFLVAFKSGNVVTCHAEDVKGYRVPKFKRDVKLWQAYGPMPLWIIGDGIIDVVQGKA